MSPTLMGNTRFSFSPLAKVGASIRLLDINAPSKAGVISWCEAHFAQRGPALLNVCYARQMDPK